MRRISFSISGLVTAGRKQDAIDWIGPNGSFGVWALFDDQPRLTNAEAAEASLLLFVHRDEFYDVMAYHVEIAQAIFKQLVHRLRRLSAIAEK